MRRAPTFMVSLVIAVFCAAAFSSCSGGMGMKKTAPALMTAPGSKAETHNREGIEHYKQEHWDVAKKHFMEAVNSDPSSAEAHYNLALALDKSGDHKAAIEHFQKAKELGKDNPAIQQSEILQAHLKKH